MCVYISKLHYFFFHIHNMYFTSNYFNQLRAEIPIQSNKFCLEKKEKKIENFFLQVCKSFAH